MLTRPLKVRLSRLVIRKNTTSDTVGKIQTSNSDQNTDTDENQSDSLGWKNLLCMAIISDNSNTNDTDRIEQLDKFNEQSHTISYLEYAKLKLTILPSKFSKLNQ